MLGAKKRQPLLFMGQVILALHLHAPPQKRLKRKSLIKEHKLLRSLSLQRNTCGYLWRLSVCLQSDGICTVKF